jgi:hypothetical protein
MWVVFLSKLKRWYHSYKVGAKVTVTGTDGSTFDLWELDGVTISVKNSVTMNYNHQLEAYFNSHILLRGAFKPLIGN